MKPKPIIKFNDGHPIALCNRCFLMMCFVDSMNDNCVIVEIRNDGKENFTSVPIGQRPPAYCDKCDKLLTYSINE